MAFNQAHWLFAYNYWVLSWRIELLQEEMSPDTYNKSLRIIYIVVTLITVGMPAIDWVLFNNRKMRAFSLVWLAENISLAISCFILTWGFKRLIKIMSTDDVLVDKAFIFWHIIAYFFIVIANVVQAFLYFKYPITYEISSYCLLVINLACSTILAAIVNTIFSKYLQPQTSSDDSSLKSVLTSSVQES